MTLVTRHAKVHDPYGVQHFVAYRDEDIIQYFLSALQDISPIPLLSELVVCHEGLPLEPTWRFQDCNLPQEPSHHVRFRSQSGVHPPQEPVVLKPIPRAGNSPGDAWKPLPVANGSRGNLLKTQEPKYGLIDTGMNLSSSPSQTFVRDPRGKTHVLLFLPTDSIATNLLRYSSHLLLPPFVDLYILSGSHVLQAECTGIENGLHHEPHLRILLRCRGGRRDGTNGSSRGKGRRQRASEDSIRGMGGGQTIAENSHTPQVRVERGRGRGSRAPDARRHTLIHAQPQEAMDDNSRYAFLIARRETLRITTSLYCQQR